MKLLSRAVILVALCLAFHAVPAPADDSAPNSGVTFAKDILPILQQNCQGCHRPLGLNLGGMVAPMPLTKYEEVRPWVKAIAKTVKSGQMPPWHASHDQAGVFLNERRLTDEQIATVVKWAESGAPTGDMKDAPEPLHWPEGGWAIGKPDLEVKFDEPFMVKDDVEDLNIDIPTQLTDAQLPEDRDIIGIEFKPGSNVVHHIIAYASQSDGKDGQEYIMLGGIAPGTEPELFPTGFGVPLRKGAKFIFQMHYHKDAGAGTGKADRSQVGLRFSEKGKAINKIHIEPIGDTAALRVPAGDPNYRITSAKTYEKEIMYIGFLPHMHLRGVYSKYVAFYPDGKQETLLEVPKWDFNWQTLYKYRQPKVIPAGTRVEVTMGYDNSPNNPANPNPKEDVVWGDPTTAEMNLGWTWWAYTNPASDDAKTVASK